MLDLGPSGFFDHEKALLTNSLAYLQSRGVDKETIQHLLEKIERKEQSSVSLGDRVFGFENQEESFEDMEYQYSGKRNPVLLKKIMKHDIEKQKRVSQREFSLGLIEAKLNERFGNPSGFRDLKNPLKRLKTAMSGESLIEPYFDAWSRLHTIYCHYSPQTNDVVAMVYHVIFDESGEYILSASVDGVIKIFNRNLQLVTTIRGHKSDISILALSFDNRHVVSADESGLVRIWEFPSGKSVAVLTEQVGHDLKTLTYHQETIFDQNTQTEVPWKGFLITSSITGGLVIYDEKNFINNGGQRNPNQEFVNLSTRLKEGDTMVGFETSEVNPVTGIIAAYSNQGNIYIWPRLRDMFPENAELFKHPVPIKVIQGIPATPNSHMLTAWSPNGR